jgi:PqqD family protein of HPr-rel-A system
VAAALAATSYLADPAAERRCVEVEGLTLLFHRKSGLTHILAPPAPQLLEALADGAATAAELAGRIAGRFELSSDDPEAAIAARLAELEAAGLVQRG